MRFKPSFSLALLWLVLHAITTQNVLAAEIPQDPSEIRLSSTVAHRAAGVSGTAPVLDPIAAMTVVAGMTGDQDLHARDADGDPIAFQKTFGPSYMTVTTIDPGTGTALGNIHLAPGPGEDVGITIGAVSASDGLFAYHQSFAITVRVPNSAPVLEQPLDMVVAALGTADQTLTATDPDGDPLSFSKVSGPSYMTVTTTNSMFGSANGNVHLAPGRLETGMATATISVYDGTLSDRKSFRITVTPTQTTWAPTGSMAVTRYNHRATLLSDGKVLVIGGATPIAELYDPATGSFSTAGVTLINHGHFPTATRLADGRVLIVGGNVAPTFAEIYDHTTGTFSATGSLNEPHHAHIAIRLLDGRVLVAGGLPGASAELFDPATGTFSPTGSLSTNRSGATATLLPDGRVLVVGGFSETTLSCLNSSELYDPSTGTFTVAGSMTESHCSLWWSDAPVLASGEALIAGGLTGSFSLDLADLFDSATGTFNATGRMTVPRAAPTVTALQSGQVLVAGGSIAGGPTTNSAELYDPPTGTFFATASMAGERLQHTATLLLDGRVLVTGGFSPFYGELRSAELYSLASPPAAALRVTAPAIETIDENMAVTFIVSAARMGGGHITLSLLPGLPTGVAFMDNGDNTGTFNWTPNFSQAGSYTVTFLGTDDDGGIGTATTAITVNNVNRAPTANPGGPYSGTVGNAISLDGSHSSDPDGDELTFAWAFGDGDTGTGPTPAHRYTAEGTYDVTLSVTDPNGLYGDAATTATIRVEIAVVVMLKNNGTTLDAKKGKGHSKFAIEETGLPYSGILANTVQLTTDVPNSGTVSSCPAELKASTSTIGDTNLNGIPDYQISFAGSCVKNLFSNVPDNSTVNVIIVGQLATSTGTSSLRGVKAVTVLTGGAAAPISASAYPNPFNPETTISYTVESAGPVTLRIYSIDGRLVRTLMRAETTGAGTHEVTWNGMDDHGRHVSSGIYFVKTSRKAGATEESSAYKLVMTK